MRIASFRVWTYISIASVIALSVLISALTNETRLLGALVLPPLIAGLKTTPRRTSIVIAISLAAAVAISLFVFSSATTTGNILRFVVLVIGSGVALQTAILHERDLRTRRRLVLINDARKELQAARGLEDALASFARAAAIEFAEWAFVDIRPVEHEAIRIVCGADESGPARLAKPRREVDAVAVSYAVRADREGPELLHNAEPKLLASLFEFDHGAAPRGVDVIVMPVAIGPVLATYFLVCPNPHPPWAEAELTQAASLALAAALTARNDQLIDQLTFARGELQASRDQIAAIVSGVADGLTAQSADGEMIFANQAAAEMLGFDSAEEMIGIAYDKVHPRMALRDAEGSPFDPEQLPSRRALRGEESPEALIRYHVLATGREWWTLVKARAVVDENGDPIMAISIIEDLTEHRQREGSHRFLADSSKRLHDLGDLSETVARVADACVPALADWCAVDLLEVNGSVSRETVIAGAEGIAGEASDAILEVINTGVLDLRDSRGPMIVPLSARGKPLGALSLGFTREGIRFTEYDVETALEYGRRAGLAIEEARDQENRTRMLEALQKSLLPSALPRFPQLDIATLFRPAEVDVDVSGDFYDAFALPDGSIALVIGDVCGKGPEAAAITALARYTIRTVAMNSSEPDEILRMLNRALLDQVSDDRFCTVAIARLRQNGSTGRAVDLVSGGHPLPVLIGGSEPRAVGESGTLLGVVPDPALPVHTVELSEGEALVLYTDGLAAGSTTDDVGFALSVMRGVEVGSAEQTIEAIERSAISGQTAPRRDDVAIVVAELTDI